MVANCISRYDETGEFVVSGVWNELWPPYEGFLKVLETEAPLGLYPVCAVFGRRSSTHAFALPDPHFNDLHLDCRSFHLYSLAQIISCFRSHPTYCDLKSFKASQPRWFSIFKGQSEVVDTEAVDLTHLIQISRAIRTMTEPSSEVIGSNILLDQIGKEFVAAEKIRIAESKRDHGRIGDRARKDGRLATISWHWFYEWHVWSIAKDYIMGEFAYAVLSRACSAFLRFSAIIVEPKNTPITESPTTRMKAGSLTAHSRAGNQLWIGLELSKNG